MKVITLNLRNEAYGDVAASVTVLTSKTKKELEAFTNMFFDVLIGTDSHGYRGSKRDTYRIATYIKKQLRLTDDELIIAKPEVIEKFY